MSTIRIGISIDASATIQAIEQARQSLRQERQDGGISDGLSRPLPEIKAVFTVLAPKGPTP